VTPAFDVAFLLDVDNTLLDNDEIEQDPLLATLSPRDIRTSDLAGEPILSVLTSAPGDAAPIGVKVVAASGWFAARPSGTEDIYKVYAESFRGADHLRRILDEAQTIVGDALAAAPETVPGVEDARTKP
jgi:phosphoglucomutase